VTVHQVALAAHRLLTDAGIDHGFGGALALNYYADPRATVDVDLCVFVPWAEGVAGIRLYKEGESAPLDVFFSLDDTYDEIAARVRPKPFGPGRHQLPFLSAEDIVLFKLSFNRDKDWVDIRRVVADGPDLDLTYVERILVAIRGPQMHPRVARLRAMVADADR